MEIELSEQHKKDRRAFREFVNKEIVPYAHQHDRDERLSGDLIAGLARQGYLESVHKL